MDNIRSIESEEVNNVVNFYFPMRDKPIDVQLTVHVNNLINCYGKDVIKEFKETLNNPESDKIGGQTINQLINYYRLENVKNWFTLIYGWEFNQKAG